MSGGAPICHFHQLLRSSLFEGLDAAGGWMRKIWVGLLHLAVCEKLIGDVRKLKTRDWRGNVRGRCWC